MRPRWEGGWNLASDALKQLYVCRSCQLRLLRVRSSRPRNLAWRTRSFSQQAAAIAPVTSVNAPKLVPKEYTHLYESLEALGKRSSSFINLSQLQLALRSLEKRDAIVRIGVLGLHGQKGARRLIRAILADPLALEADWEEQLQLETDENRGLLIRYGDVFALDDRNSLFRTLSIPSTFLERHKLEILVSKYHTANVQGQVDEVVKDQLLTPALETPPSATGHGSMIAFPVHKTLVFGDGVRAFQDTPLSVISRMFVTGRLMAVINVVWRDIQTNGEECVALVNLDQAESALNAFRVSLKNATDYEHGWTSSNISEVESFLTRDTSIEAGALKPLIGNLIQDIINDTTIAIDRESAKYTAAAKSDTTPNDVTQVLEGVVDDWAEFAHTELRDKLEAAFQSASWKKLAWWKLPWRIDDVHMLISDILQRGYLVDSEKRLIWIAGRIEQAGFHVHVAQAEDVAPPKRSLSDPVPIPKLHDVVPAKIDDTALEYDPSQPWPQQLALSRGFLVTTSIPPLQARGQQLLLQGFTTTALTSALSTLLYISLSTTSIYEAGAVATFGLIWSARRLQSKWETARREWMVDIKEEGKRVLNSTERTCRGFLGGTVSAANDDRYQEEMNEAREALHRVRDALDIVTASDTSSKPKKPS